MTDAEFNREEAKWVAKEGFGNKAPINLSSNAALQQIVYASIKAIWTVQDSNGDVLVSINKDGSVEYHPKLQLDEAAKIFWQSVERIVKPVQVTLERAVEVLQANQHNFIQWQGSPYYYKWKQDPNGYGATLIRYDNTTDEAAPTPGNAYESVLNNFEIFAIAEKYLREK